MNDNTNTNNTSFTTLLDQSMSRMLSDRLAKTMFEEATGSNGYNNRQNNFNTTVRSAPVRNNSQYVRQNDGSIISARTLRNRRRRQNQRQNRSRLNTTNATTKSNSRNNQSQTRQNQNRVNNSGTQQSNNRRQNRQLDSIPEESKGSDLAHPERGYVSNNKSNGKKLALYNDAREKKLFLKSAIFPELGDPRKFPGMGLSAVGKFWQSYTLTSTGTAINMCFCPQDFNANTTGWFGYSLTGALVGNTGVQPAAPYSDATQLERARVTSAAMIVSCVNPDAANSSGVIAVSYQGKAYWTPTVGYKANLSQKDIEQAVTQYNGTICGLSETAKAVWVPMDSSDMCYLDSGHAYTGKNFIGCYVSNTNVNTTYRVDLYINYEYEPGENIEDIVTTTAPVLVEDPGLWGSVYKMISNTGKSFLSNSLDVTDPDSIAGMAFNYLGNAAAGYFGGPVGSILSDSIIGGIQGGRKDSLFSDYSLV